MLPEGLFPGCATGRIGLIQLEHETLPHAWRSHSRALARNCRGKNLAGAHVSAKLAGRKRVNIFGIVSPFLAYERENYSTEVNFMKQVIPLRTFLSLALVAVVAAGAIAQDNEGGRRPGRGGGPGGPGGGRPGGFGGGGDPVIGLLMVEKVREEIELMPDQEEALTKLRDSEPQGAPPNLDFRSMSEEERTKAFAEMQERRKKRETEMREKLEEVLLPEQLERLEQISIQSRGPRALEDPAIAAKLNFTDEQKTKMEDVRSKSGERMRALFSSGDRDKMREGFEKLRKESEEEVLAVLTADQRKQFEEMKGKPFELPEGSFGRGFGGGRPGGFGGGRPGGDEGGDRGRGRRRPASE